MVNDLGSTMYLKYLIASTLYHKLNSFAVHDKVYWEKREVTGDIVQCCDVMLNEWLYRMHLYAILRQQLDQ